MCASTTEPQLILFKTYSEQLNERFDRGQKNSFPIDDYATSLVNIMETHILVLFRTRPQRLTYRVNWDLVLDQSTEIAKTSSQVLDIAVDSLAEKKSWLRISLLAFLTRDFHIEVVDFKKNTVLYHKRVEGWADNMAEDSQTYIRLLPYSDIVALTSRGNGNIFLQSYTASRRSRTIETGFLDITSVLVGR